MANSADPIGKATPGSIFDRLMKRRKALEITDENDGTADGSEAFRDPSDKKADDKKDKKKNKKAGLALD